MKKYLLASSFVAVLLLGIFQVTHADISSNLQLWWKFDDGSQSSAFDSSGNSNNGTLVNSPTYATGKIGSNAISLNGTSQYVQVPVGQTFGYPTSDTTNAYALTFSAWFKTTTGGVIFSQDNGTLPPNGPGGYVPVIYVNPSTGKIYASMFWHGSVTYQIISPNSYMDGNWHQVVDTYSAGTETLYVDGATVGTQAASEASYSGLYDYFIGAGYGSSWPGLSASWNYFGGSIDDVRIYSQALTAQDVSSLYSYRDSGDFMVGGGNSNPMAPDNSTPLTGWAWSSNTGWISFNSSDAGTGNGGTGLSPVQYGVSVSTSTNPATFSGDAWSSNVGWISFDPGDAADCPGGPASAPVDANGNLAGQVTGYVRVLNAQDGANGWDGCVKLGDPSSSDYQYSPTLDTNTFPGSDGKAYLKGGVTYSQALGFFRGFAWSGFSSTTALGWISFENPLAPVKPCFGPNCISTAGPDFTLIGNTVNLTKATPTLATSISIQRSGTDDSQQIITPSIGTLPPNITARITTPPATCTLDSNVSTCNVSVTVTQNGAADGAYQIPVIGTRSSDNTPHSANIVANVSNGNNDGGSGPISLYIGSTISIASAQKTTSYSVKKGNPFALVWNINLDPGEYSCSPTASKPTWPTWSNVDLSVGNLPSIDTSTNSAASYSFGINCTSNQGNSPESAAVTLILESSSESEF